MAAPAGHDHARGRSRTSASTTSTRRSPRRRSTTRSSATSRTATSRLSIWRGNRRKILTAIAAIMARERGGWHPPPPPPPLSLFLVRAPSVVTPPRSPPRPVEAADAECSICMDSSVEVRIVGCGHTMCSSCASDWFARTPAGQQTECPTCRGPCADFEPLRRAPPVPPVPPVPPCRRGAGRRARDDARLRRVYPILDDEAAVGGSLRGRRPRRRRLDLEARQGSTTMGMVEFSEPAAAAKAVRAWHNKAPTRRQEAEGSGGTSARRTGATRSARANGVPSSRSCACASRPRNGGPRRPRRARRGRVAASELTALRGRNELRARAEDAEAASAAATARAPSRERRAARRRGERGGRDGGARANADLRGNGGGARGSPGADDRRPDARPGRLRVPRRARSRRSDLLGEVRHLPRRRGPLHGVLGGRARERRRAEMQAMPPGAVTAPRC